MPSMSCQNAVNSSNQCRYSTNDAYHYERICHARNDIEICLERQR